MLSWWDTTTNQPHNLMQMKISKISSSTLSYIFDDNWSLLTHWIVMSNTCNTSNNNNNTHNCLLYESIFDRIDWKSFFEWKKQKYQHQKDTTRIFPCAWIGLLPIALFSHRKWYISFGVYSVFSMEFHTCDQDKRKEFPCNCVDISNCCHSIGRTERHREAKIERNWDKCRENKK